MHCVGWLVYSQAHFLNRRGNSILVCPIDCSERVHSLFSVQTTKNFTEINRSICPVLFCLFVFLISGPLPMFLFSWAETKLTKTVVICGWYVPDYRRQQVHRRNAFSEIPASLKSPRVRIAAFLSNIKMHCNSVSVSL